MSGATYTTPWDADMIRGCACARALSVDNQYDASYLTQLPWLYQVSATSQRKPPKPTLL